MTSPDVSSPAGATVPATATEGGGCGSRGKTPCANCCRRATAAAPGAAEAVDTPEGRR